MVPLGSTIFSASWHVGNKAECGGLCKTNLHKGRVTIRIYHDGFEVAPFDLTNG